MPDVELMILIGAYAQRHYLDLAPTDTITATVKIMQRNFYHAIFLIVHPSPRNNIWLKKNPWFLTDVVPALQTTVKQILTQHGNQSS